MSEAAVLAIDQGTTSSRAIVFNHEGRIVASGQKEHEQIFPRAGWVEHNPAEIWDNIREVVGIALAQASVNKDNIVAVGVTNQRETAMVWDKTTGKPVYNAIVWQDTRTASLCERLAGDDILIGGERVTGKEACQGKKDKNSNRHEGFRMGVTASIPLRWDAAG